MNRLVSIIILIFTISAGFMWAQTDKEFRCVFVEGKISIGEAGNWRDLETGMTAGPNTSLKVPPDGIATFQTGSRQVTISSSGTYRIGDISREIPQRQRVTMMDTFLTKLKTILNPDKDVQNQTMGVRAAEAESPGFEWTDVDEEDFEYALDMIGEGDLEEAEYTLDDLIMFGNPYQTDEYRFYMAYTLLLQNRSGEALKQLSMIEEASSFDFYEGYLILYGRLLYESMNDKKSCEIWKEYLERFPHGDAVPEAEEYLKDCN